MSALNPDQITRDDFQDALSRYDQLLEAVSTSKGGTSLRKPRGRALQQQNANELIAKFGQRTLAELDAYRYVEAPARFAATEKPGSSRSTMQLQDVKTLVEWKL